MIFWTDFTCVEDVNLFLNSLETIELKTVSRLWANGQPDNCGVVLDLLGIIKEENCVWVENLKLRHNATALPLCGIIHSFAIPTSA